jgi:predicted HicB family RNase H-like nuclease
MNDPRTFAKLSPSLLARKGSALPAMRSPANANQHHRDATARQLNEDLGYDDMGHEDSAREADVIALNPGASFVQAAQPDIVRQQASVAARLTRAPMKRRSALADGRSAAFTLRLDAERHLQLRMACTLQNRSAQQLIIDALDQMIADLPDVTMLVAQAAKRR